MNSPATASLTAADCLPPLFHELAISLRQLSQWAQQATTTEADTPTVLASMSVLLGQVEAAFAMAGADSLAAITSLSHRIVTTQSENPAPFPAELASTLSQTFGILTEAMEPVLASEPLPVSNFLPCWAALAAWDRTGNAHPSAMLSLHVDHRMLPTVAVPEEQGLLTDPRGEFERALLRFLRSDLPEEVLQAAQRITQVISALASIAQPASEKTSWLVLHAATGLISEEKTSDVALSKKILAATGRVIRHIGSTELPPVPAVLVREALFMIATAKAQTPESACIVQAFDLDNQLPFAHAPNPALVTGDAIAITAVSDEIKSLIAVLDTPGMAVLPTPAQLDNLIQSASPVPEIACVTIALSRLQARLSAQQVHSTQALAIAACLLSLQTLMGLITRLKSSQSIALRIASNLDAIGNAVDIPGWRNLQVMGITLQIPALLISLRDALIGSLLVTERQIERLIDEAPTASEREAALVAIDHRISEVHAALTLLDGQTLLTSLQEIREQLPTITLYVSSDKDVHRRDLLAQKFVRLSALLAGIPRTHDIDDSSSVLEAVLPFSREDETQAMCPAFDTHQSLHVIFLDEAKARLQQLGSWLHAAPTNKDFQWESAANAAHALAGCSATVGLAEMRQLALAMEAVLTEMRTGDGSITEPVLSALQKAWEALEHMLADLSSGRMPQAQPAILEQLLALSLTASESASERDYPQDDDAESLPVMESTHAPETTAAMVPLQNQQAQPPASENHADSKVLLQTGTSISTASPAKLGDPMHDELHDIFVEEAADLMPQLDQQLRTWIAEPSEAEAPAQMLRILHTLKGSARMAGEIRLGDELHQMEQTVAELSQQLPPDQASLRSLETALDQLLQAFVPATAVSPSVVGDGQASDVKPASADVDLSAATHPRQAVPATAMPEKTPQTMQLRVRAEFLDRITTSGAELLVGSSRMTSELQLQRQSVNDLSDNLARLRAQLRELEIHAESRIASGFTPSNAAEFDPLEFDRYTRLHELTRMMSESIADISSLQRTLSRQLDNTLITVTAQGRHARTLQSDLRRVRTLPFASLSGRLQHLLRQAAREKVCDVVMEIDGGNLEIDRGVLDRITGPLEHLVRNAVAHGIETAAERLSLGKSATGRVRMDLSQQGNTLQLQISDDGRGLDYARIRERAIAAGLLTLDAQADDATLAELIFEPGFSTASKVTELSGRGIGMDAVRVAVIALGGHLKVLSQRGVGTRFIFSLPLTLATMQVVQVTAGSREVALPATLVQQMLQLSSSELAQARAAGELEWQGRHVPLHRLDKLLSEPISGQETATRTPVAVLRQLDQYLAIELDAVIGHREVVVKNLGPQLAKVPGIAGATVLGDGRITLIINPLPLPDFVAAHASMSANVNPAEVSTHQAPRILVVDDSLTVRRASQRLLERHGYAVTLARDGLDALEQLRLNTPAAVLLDIEMPRMDGFELLTALRDDARWRALPVAMITSRTAERHRDHAMKLGATAYLGKPFVEEELLGLLAQWLAAMPAEFRRENRIPADVSG
jgi:chemosensory pili system protein ChpA (sensor histidine kinase/response regulator)